MGNIVNIAIAAVVAVLVGYAVVHFHLIPRVKTAIEELFAKHATTAQATSPGGVTVNVNSGNDNAQPPSPPAVGSDPLPPQTVGGVPPVVTAPPAAIGTGALPAGIDTPDANGFVALTGLNPNGGRTNLRFAIAEVGAALTGVQHASVALNCGFLANGRWITGQFIGVCAQIEPVTDGTTGATTYRVKTPEVDIPGTLALPPHFTVESATAYFNSLPAPVQVSGHNPMPKA